MHHPLPVAVTRAGSTGSGNATDKCRKEARSAAGAVGSVVAQIAKLKGCRVIGSVGSEAKAQWLRDELGVNAVINYNTEPDLEAALRRVAPEGIDVYFDNVGGAHLEAAIAVANNFARFPLCGMVGQYNSAPTGQATSTRLSRRACSYKALSVSITWIPGLTLPKT